MDTPVAIFACTHTAYCQLYAVTPFTSAFWFALWFTFLPVTLHTLGFGWTQFPARLCVTHPAPPVVPFALPLHHTDPYHFLPFPTCTLLLQQTPPPFAFMPSPYPPSSTSCSALPKTLRILTCRCPTLHHTCRAAPFLTTVAHALHVLPITSAPAAFLSRIPACPTTGPPPIPPFGRPLCHTTPHPPYGKHRAHALVYPPALPRCALWPSPVNVLPVCHAHGCLADAPAALRRTHLLPRALPAPHHALFARRRVRHHHTWPHTDNAFLPPLLDPADCLRYTRLHFTLPGCLPALPAAGTPPVCRRTAARTLWRTAGYTLPSSVRITAYCSCAAAAVSKQQLPPTFCAPTRSTDWTSVRTNATYPFVVLRTRAAADCDAAVAKLRWLGLSCAVDRIPTKRTVVLCKRHAAITT